jgi:hypothetical protein
MDAFAADDSTQRRAAVSREGRPHGYEIGTPTATTGDSTTVTGFEVDSNNADGKR